MKIRSVKFFKTGNIVFFLTFVTYYCERWWNFASMTLNAVYSQLTFIDLTDFTTGRSGAAGGSQKVELVRVVVHAMRGGLATTVCSPMNY